MMNFYPLLADALKIPVLLMLLIGIGRYFYGGFTLKLKHTIVRNNIELIFGSIILFSGYAIIKTSGKTVLSLALIMLVLQYFFFKIRPKFSNLTFNKSDIINLASISIIFFLLFALQLFKYDYFNEKVTHFGYCDYSSYSDLAERMLLNGNETYLDWHSFFNKYNFSYETLPLPYHFYELWIDTFLLSISYSKGIYVFLYLLIPFLGTLVFTSLFSFLSVFFKQLNQKKWLLLFTTAFLFLFFVGKIPFKDGGFWSYPLSHPHVFSFYIIFPLFIVLQKLNHQTFAYTTLSFLIYFNILYFPTVLAVFFSFCIFFLLITKNKKLALLNAGLFLMNLLLIFIFYFILFKANKSNGASIDFKDFFPIANYLKKVVYQLVRLNFMRLWFFYLPLFLFVIYYIVKKIRTHNFSFLKNELLISVALFYFFSSLFAASVPHLERETIGVIVFNPLFTILSLYGVVYLIKNNISVVSYSILTLIVLQAFYSFYYNVSHYDAGVGYSTQFIENIKNNFKVKNKVGAAIKHIPKEGESAFQYHPTLFRHTSVLDIVENGYVASLISVPLNEDDCPYHKIKPYITQTPFYKFGNYKMLQEGIKDLGEIQKQFLQEYNIGYLFVDSRAKIPTKIEPLVDKVFLDELSGLKLLTLKQEHQDSIANISF